MKFNRALVTGASSGIGKAICEFLAQKGINLIIAGRNETALYQLQKSLSSYVEVYVFIGDLGCPEDRLRLIQEIHRQGPELVINNAGFGLYGDALSYETGEQVSILEVNALSVLEIALEAARTLVSKEKKGVIINVSSAAAFQVFPGFAVYAASKACVNHFSQSLDFEMQPYGIRVLTICPGMVETHFRERAGGAWHSKEEIKAMSPEFVAQEVWRQIQDGQALRIVNWKYRFLTYLSYCFPKKWIAERLRNNINQRLESRHLIRSKDE
jgi:uncharacterized protein